MYTWGISGPQFLLIYGVLLSVTVLFVVSAQRPGGRGPAQRGEMLELDPYEIAYRHVAGGVERDGLYHDTHVHPTPPAVLELVAELCARRDSPG